MITHSPHTLSNILTADKEALVNPVNCVGVMGKGLALQFKTAFPDNYTSYATACKNNEVKPGEMFITSPPSCLDHNPKYIINFPTKRHWRDKSRLTDITDGLTALAHEIETRNIKSVAIPRIGCGLGGLDWNDVYIHVLTILTPIKNTEIFIFVNPY